MVKRGQLIIAVLATAVIGFFIGRLTGPGGTIPPSMLQPMEEVDAPRAQAAPPTTDSPLIPAEGAAARGAAADQARVTIVEFSDFQCPFSKRGRKPIEQLLQRYEGRLRHVFRHHPLSFHKQAGLAAVAAEAARAQGRFWPMHEKLFANQRALQRDDLARYAKEIGLDMGRFLADLDSDAYEQVVDGDSHLAKKLQARGTPTLFINGVRVAGAKPLEELATIVDRELKASEASLAQGVAQSDLYAARVKENYAPAKRSQRSPKAKDDDTLYKVPVGSSYADGPEDALVTAVIFSDFECPYCGRLVPTFKRLRARHPDDLRVVFKHNPLAFHKSALGASQAALAAGKQGRFWEMHDKLFANRKALTRPDLDRYAKDLGLDMRRFSEDMEGDALAYAIRDDQRLAKRVGARGTPNTFINGRKVGGAKSYDVFEAEVEKALSFARKLVDKGTPRSRVYETLMANAQERALDARKKLDPRKQRRRKEDPKAIYKVPLPEGDAYAKGAKDALVTIVEFSDFQCPYCGKVNPTLRKLLELYPRDLRIVFRHNPLGFHKQARGAAMASLAAAQQGRFWEMHDLLFANARALQPEQLEGYARQLQLNLAQFQRFVEGGAGDARIDADRALARSLGARGTPSFFVNGRKLSGVRPLDQFKRVIDEELARARALLATGVPRARLYEALIADGATKPVYLPGAGDAPPSPRTGRKLDQPVVLRPAKIGDSPVRGGTTAEADIIVFSDFQCPFCGRAERVVERIAEEYGDRVRVAFKQSPLPIHKDAFAAAEASLAAHEQGKFWEMHDKLFANPKALKPADLERYAKEIGLDMNQFLDAMRTRRFKAQVEADLAEGRSLGVRGTPSFFINGRFVRGAVPYEQFKGVLEEELYRRQADARKQPRRALKRPVRRRIDLDRLSPEAVRRLGPKVRERIGR